MVVVAVVVVSSKSSNKCGIAWFLPAVWLLGTALEKEKVSCHAHPA